ncbi:uncharacterized protein KGF55_005140 [Candida pseudojiufengensis]|uniref:uncharacterized protein n=1 Tax=Candida pseudojiufengensis TaxID=497109 RepID=UPI002224B699|nr:uncharacterized protein KGF55_005140 [Candida pseudojiufengensis]KAI5959908.1 hypothetical protein KGF55_005140 [Candida pseudojiufengensis]
MTEVESTIISISRSTIKLVDEDEDNNTKLLDKTIDGENKIQSYSTIENSNLKQEETKEQQPIEKQTKDEKPQQRIEPEYQTIAKRLFNEDFVSIKPSEYTQYLATNDEESTKIRNYYMNLFKWSPNLLISTRSLCSKLYLKAESQELDRILTSFTKSYIKQYPNNVFCTKNFEQIYIIIYSLILLNTSLHNSEVNKKSKISQTDFIKNTMSTFLNGDPKIKKSLSIKQKIGIENELSRYYEDLNRNELYLKDNKNKSNREAGPSHNSPKNKVSQTEEDINDDDLNTTINTSYDSHDGNLSRQLSNSSIWSTDTTNRRNSLAMKRISTTTSEVSNFTASGQQTRIPQRVGLARALIGQQQQQQNQQQLNGMYKNLNPSLQSQATTLRNRSSFDQQRSVNKRSSIASIMSKESNNGADDTISVLSFDTCNLDLDDEKVQEMDKFDVNDFQDEYDLQLELNGSPYLKEGLLKLRVLNNDSNDEATTTTSPIPTNNRFLSFFNRQPSRSSIGIHSSPILHKFNENFVVVSKGELSLYSFDPKLVKKYKKETSNQESEEEIGDGNWLKNAAKIGTYNLCSTFAQLEKSVNGKIIWSLTFPKISKRLPKKFIFEAGTKDIALEFINTCNFWASKITAIPTLEESISSIEYGWTDLDGLIKQKDSFKKLRTIQKWEPIINGVYLSNYYSQQLMQNNHFGMMKQFVKTSNYYNNLRKLYNDFVTKRSKFLENFNKMNYNCSNYNKIINNYDSKIEIYKQQLKMYKSYIIILGFALQLRFDLEASKRKEILDNSLEEQEEEEIEEIIESSSLTSVLPNDDDLTKSVKLEIKKLFYNMKDISKIIPTFKSSKSIKNLAELAAANHQQQQFLAENNKLVKSPKNFTLSNYKDNESPIAQLIASTSTNTKDNSSDSSISPPQKQSMMQTTIREEDEDEVDPEDDDEKTKTNLTEDDNDLERKSSEITKVEKSNSNSSSTTTSNLKLENGNGNVRPPLNLSSSSHNDLSKSALII